MDCIFCDIVQRKASAEIIYENEKVISFLDIRPLNHGHALVIPKNHYVDFLSLPQDEIGEIAKAVQNVAKAVKESLNPDGINIIINNGIAAGQTVFHFHYHIIPRFTNDSFKFKPIFKKYELNLMQEFADKIRNAVK